MNLDIHYAEGTLKRCKISKITVVTCSEFLAFHARLYRVYYEIDGILRRMCTMGMRTLIMY